MYESNLSDISFLQSYNHYSNITSLSNHQVRMFYVTGLRDW